MSSFTTDPKLKFLGNYEFEILEPFEYHIGEYPSAEVYVVPVGAVTDFASIPRKLWGIFPPHGPWAKAAIIHDQMYVEAYKTKKFADRVFYEAMGVLGVDKPTRISMYLAVRLFGRGNYK